MRSRICGEVLCSKNHIVMGRRKMTDAGSMRVEYISIDSLIPAEYNPRRITETDRNDIKASLEKFGFAEPVIVNKHPERMNVIVGGHQRVLVAKEDLGYKEVPCVFVNLTLEEERELNVRLNKNQGRWDYEALQSYFDKDWLKNIGFLEDELSFWVSDFQKKFDSVTNKNCDYPIVPKFSEKYDAVVIISTNVTDTAFLKTALGITKQQSYKCSRMGEGMVITVEQLRKAMGDGNRY